MGRKSKEQSWPEAIRLCRLNQNDVEMAKRLGFQPASLIRARPDPKQKWKLPVKDWIHELHLKKFGQLIGETKSNRKALAPAAPIHFWPSDWEQTLEEDYAARREEIDDEPIPFDADNPPF